MLLPHPLYFFLLPKDGRQVVQPSEQPFPGPGPAAASSHLTSQLTASSTGVIGMPGLALSTQPSTAAQGSVITSSKQNVHLDGGTQMVLRVNIQ